MGRSGKGNKKGFSNCLTAKERLEKEIHTRMKGAGELVTNDVEIAMVVPYIPQYLLLRLILKSLMPLRPEGLPGVRWWRRTRLLNTGQVAHVNAEGAG